MSLEASGAKRRRHTAVRAVKADVPVNLSVYAPHGTALARCKNAYCGNCGSYRTNEELKYGAHDLIFCRYCGKRVRVRPIKCRQNKIREKRKLEKRKSLKTLES